MTEAEASKICFDLTAIPKKPRRYPAKDARALMLAGSFVMRGGHGYFISTKPIGAGVYEVWAERTR